MLYKRTKKVLAKQFTGNNVQEMKDFLAEAKAWYVVGKDVRNFVAICFEYKGMTYSAWKWDWVVLGEDRIEVYNPQEFDENFTRVIPITQIIETN